MTNTQDTLLYNKTSSEQLPCCFFTQITGPLSPNSPKPLFLYFFFNRETFFLSLFVCLFLHMCVGTDMLPTRRSEDNLRQLVLSFYHVGPKD